MLALMSAVSRNFLKLDDEFSSFMGPAITLDTASLESLSIDEMSTDGKNNDAPGTRICNKLQRLRIENSSRSSPNEIISLVNRCNLLREISLPYHLLSDDLLFALSTEDRVCLETVKIDIQSDARPLPRIGDEAWIALEHHSPNINIVLTSFLSDDDDYDELLSTYVPITHLYFGADTPISLARKIGENCPRLVELVVSSYGPDVIDAQLISAANGCPRLNSVGLGDCEITCSGLIDFVSRCRDRLQVLYIWETSIVEDAELDIAETVARVSRILGRTWAPEYVPPW